MLKKKYNEFNCKGCTLKAVITRIDYDDLYEIEKDKLKELKKIAKENRLKYNLTRELNEQDFELNDSTALRDLPNEYIKQCMCYVHLNKETRTIVEINQFFIRIIYRDVKENYETYEKTVYPVVLKFIKTLMSEELVIKRISIKKVDEIDFSSIEELSKNIKPEITQTNIFGEEAKWDIPNAGSLVVQNFGYKDKMVNFLRRIDKLKIRKLSNGKKVDTIFYRIYLDYEVYKRSNEIKIDNNELKKILNEINKVTEDLYLETLTEEGWRYIKNGGEFPNYECD